MKDKKIILETKRKETAENIFKYKKREYFNQYFFDEEVSKEYSTLIDTFIREKNLFFN
jgi:hypothetical protein